MSALTELSRTAVPPRSTVDNTPSQSTSPNAVTRKLGRVSSSSEASSSPSSSATSRDPSAAAAAADGSGEVAEEEGDDYGSDDDDTRPSFRVTAYGDLDCDGVLSTFYRGGTAVGYNSVRADNEAHRINEAE